MKNKTNNQMKNITTLKTECPLVYNYKLLLTELAISCATSVAAIAVLWSYLGTPLTAGSMLGVIFLCKSLKVVMSCGGSIIKTIKTTSKDTLKKEMDLYYNSTSDSKPKE